MERLNLREPYQTELLLRVQVLLLVTSKDVGNTLNGLFSRLELSLQKIQLSSLVAQTLHVRVQSSIKQLLLVALP